MPKMRVLLRSEKFRVVVTSRDFWRVQKTAVGHDEISPAVKPRLFATPIPDDGYVASELGLHRKWLHR
jgi:hypothetical protein